MHPRNNAYSHVIDLTLGRSFIKPLAKEPLAPGAAPNASAPTESLAEILGPSVNDPNALDNAIDSGAVEIVAAPGSDDGFAAPAPGPDAASANLALAPAPEQEQIVDDNTPVSVRRGHSGCSLGRRSLFAFGKFFSTLIAWLAPNCKGWAGREKFLPGEGWELGGALNPKPWRGRAYGSAAERSV